MNKENGNCFEVALGICLIDSGTISDTVEEKAPGEQIRIVHAMVCGQGKCYGWWISHAWVEAGGLAFDFSNGNEVIIPALLYHSIGNVGERECFSYTLDEARRKAIDHGHYGPWDFDGSKVRRWKDGNQ